MLIDSAISPSDKAATSSNRIRPRRAADSALTTTIACSVPVFLIGGLAVQTDDELKFSPAGLGLAVPAYFGAGALASVPITIAAATRSLWTLIAILARHGIDRRMAVGFRGGCSGPLSLGAVASGAGHPTMWTVAAEAMLGAAALMVVGSRMLRNRRG
ncbi:hypothetical protein GCM10010435_45200 [Winogradskya consettensis]|uniref:Uncharacterized protein n=1 Tax=Winogradskya consettensis TaxID=113560 RepID=A0A919T2U1_9ACTN|nr:hypothetical protein [Actinoplanes consettensis]GIM82851.1 hypothetical protein Aco04nite_83590 [Actinoplanes consettensis]